jgi:hypothetical protein
MNRQISNSSGFSREKIGRLISAITEGEIKGYLAKGVNLANVARICDVSWSTMKHLVSSRGLAG